MPATRTFSLEQIEAAIEEYRGFCISCGAESDGIEPDAREYTCDECDEDAVFGAEELLVMGLVE